MAHNEAKEDRIDEIRAEINSIKQAIDDLEIQTIRQALISFFSTESGRALVMDRLESLTSEGRT